MPKLQTPMKDINEVAASGADGLSLVRFAAGYIAVYQGGLYLFRPEASIANIVLQVAGDGIVSPEDQAEARSALKRLTVDDEAFTRPLFSLVAAAMGFSQVLFMDDAAIAEMNSRFKYVEGEDDVATTLH